MEEGVITCLGMNKFSTLALAANNIATGVEFVDCGFTPQNPKYGEFNLAHYKEELVKWYAAMQSRKDKAISEDKKYVAKLLSDIEDLQIENKELRND